MCIPFQASMVLYIHCLYTCNTCTYIVCTCYVHVLRYTYSLNTSYIQFFTFLSYASWQQSSILYIDCLDHTQTTLIPVGTGYTQLFWIWSVNVRLCPGGLWFFSFSGKYMYIHCFCWLEDILLIGRCVLLPLDENINAQALQHKASMWGVYSNMKPDSFL